MPDLVLASIDRAIQLAEVALDRLRAGDQLSTVLPEARLLAEARGDKLHVHWIDCEMYGLPTVPFGEKPRRDREERAAALLFMELRGVQDIEKLRVDDLVAGKRPDPSKKDAVLCQSVGELERLVAEYQERPNDYYYGWATDQTFQAHVLHGERERVLDRVRAYLHRYVGGVWLRAQQERGNVELLGPDYRIVLDSLEALDTDVGQELLAALSRLGSTNPAEWSLSALACRNVILGLGRKLFPLRTGTHRCAMWGKDLELKGEKEVNWLMAYIDLHWQKADDESKEELEDLAKLARDIYETGSRGKRGTQLRHERVQKLVVDTFRLVLRLKEVTGLEPLDKGSAATGG